MKRIIYFSFINFVFCSCDLFTPYREAEYVYFILGNRGNSVYKDIIVFAKDSTNKYIDSSYREFYTAKSKYNVATVPNSKDVQVGIILSHLKDVKSGVFEVQANILNGKLLSQEFGLIDGLNTRQEFKIDLKDSTIIIK